LTGEDEARAFEQRNYVGLHQSTLRKVDVIANILSRVQDRALKTNTTRWEMHGGRLREIWNWIVDNKTIAFAFALGGLLLAVLAIWKS